MHCYTCKHLVFESNRGRYGEQCPLSDSPQLLQLPWGVPTAPILWHDSWAQQSLSKTKPWGRCSGFICTCVFMNFGVSHHQPMSTDEILHLIKRTKLAQTTIKIPGSRDFYCLSSFTAFSEICQILSQDLPLFLHIPRVCFVYCQSLFAPTFPAFFTLSNFSNFEKVEISSTHYKHLTTLLTKQNHRTRKLYDFNLEVSRPIAWTRVGIQCILKVLYPLTFPQFLTTKTQSLVCLY